MKLLLTILTLFALTSVSQSARNQKLTKRQQQQSINDGHKLITRALWRIFDAINEKKNHEPLYSRMKSIEGSLNDIATSETNLDNQLKDMSMSISNHKREIQTINKEILKIKNLESRMKKIEAWHLRLQRDETASSYIGDIAQPVFSQCPEPFGKIGGQCMFISTAKKLGWRDARKSCASIGGDLASPKDLPALRAYLQKLESAVRPEYVWLGGSKTYDNSWVWSTGKQSGSAIDMSQQTWNEKLPEGAGDCMGLYERADYRAYDYACSEKDYFICQHFL